MALKAARAATLTNEIHQRGVGPSTATSTRGVRVYLYEYSHKPANIGVAPLRPLWVLHILREQYQLPSARLARAQQKPAPRQE